MKEGHISSRVSLDGITPFFNWRPVTTISLIHRPSEEGTYTIKISQPIFAKPPVIVDYNQHVNSVSEQLISGYSVQCVWTCEWTKNCSSNYLICSWLTDSLFTNKSENKTNPSNSFRWFREHVKQRLVMSAPTGGPYFKLFARGPRLEQCIEETKDILLVQTKTDITDAAWSVPSANNELTWR